MSIQGLYTALITPFSHGAVYYGKLKEIVEMQIAGGVDGILPTEQPENPRLSAWKNISMSSKR